MRGKGSVRSCGNVAEILSRDGMMFANLVRYLFSKTILSTITIFGKPAERRN